MSLSSTTFQEILSSVLEGMPWQTISVVHLMLVNILSSKGVVTPKKIINQNLLCICVYTQFVFHNYNVSRNFDEQFLKSCADKKNQDWRTGQKHSTLQLAWGIITVSMCLIIIVFWVCAKTVKTFKTVYIVRILLSTIHRWKWRPFYLFRSIWRIKKWIKLNLRTTDTRHMFLCVVNAIPIWYATTCSEWKCKELSFETNTIW